VNSTLPAPTRTIRGIGTPARWGVTSRHPDVRMSR
jgi:hypothetical protein